MYAPLQANSFLFLTAAIKPCQSPTPGSITCLSSSEKVPADQKGHASLCFRSKAHSWPAVQPGMRGLLSGNDRLYLYNCPGTDAHLTRYRASYTSHRVPPFIRKPLLWCASTTCAGFVAAMVAPSPALCGMVHRASRLCLRSVLRIIRILCIFPLLC